MDGVHDLGGREGYGPVDLSDDGVFVDEWEKRSFGLALAAGVMGVNTSTSQHRHSVERMDAVHYLTTRYYEHWVDRAITRMVETGKVDVPEAEARAGGRIPLSLPDVAVAGEVPDRPSPAPAVGDRVRVRLWHPRGHSRCPQYVKGKVGTVVRIDPPAQVPDLEAHVRTAVRTEPICCVRFEAADLWGTDDGAARSAVHVDLWTCYLDLEPT